MDISQLSSTRSLARSVNRDIKDLRRDLASGDSASVAGLIDRIERDSNLAIDSCEAVDRRIREMLGR